MKLKLILIFSIVKIFSGFVVVASLKNTSIVECSDALGCNRYKSDQLYVFGGYNSEHDFLSSASQFNSSTGEWEATTDMPVAKRAVCGAVVGTKIYLFGGDVGGRLKTAEIYDCETGTYSQYRSMLTGVSDCGAAVLNDFIYVAGGWDGTRSISNVIRYNIRTTRREKVRSMQIARSTLQLVQLNGRLYAVGGGTKTVEAYNPTTDRWIPVASTKYSHTYSGTAVHEGKIYVCSHLGFEVYSPDEDEWETLTPPKMFRAATLVSMNGRLWVLGGGDPTNKFVSTYNTSTKKWSEQMDMDVARKHHIAFVVNH